MAIAKLNTYTVTSQLSGPQIVKISKQPKIMSIYIYTYVCMYVKKGLLKGDSSTSITTGDGRKCPTRATRLH